MAADPTAVEPPIAAGTQASRAAGTFPAALTVEAVLRPLISPVDLRTAAEMAAASPQSPEDFCRIPLAAREAISRTIPLVAIVALVQRPAREILPEASILRAQSPRNSAARQRATRQTTAQWASGDPLETHRVGARRDAPSSHRPGRSAVRPEDGIRSATS